MNLREQVIVARFKRKIEKRDRKIKALEEYNRQLERQVAQLRINFPRDLEDIVQRAICNVRMIPIIGINKNSKILEVKVSNEN